MLEKFARLGYASKAVIYAIVGVLAVLTTVNRGGRITDSSGALRVVLTQLPIGLPRRRNASAPREETYARSSDPQLHLEAT